MSIPNLKIRFRSTSKTDFEIISQPEIDIPTQSKDKTVRGSPYTWFHPEINIPPKLRHKQYKHLACQTPPNRNNTHPYLAQPRGNFPQTQTITSKSMPSTQHETKSKESQDTNTSPTQLPNSGLLEEPPQQPNTPHQKPHTPNNKQDTISQHSLSNNINCLIKLVSLLEDRLNKSDTDNNLKNKQIFDYQRRSDELQARNVYLRKEMECLLKINNETTRDLHEERRQRRKDKEYFQDIWYKNTKHTKKL